MTLENYIQDDLSNVTLTIIEGEIAYEIENDELMQSVGAKMKKGDSISVEIENFHKIHTISSTPSCYMYTYVRSHSTEDNGNIHVGKRYAYSPFPILEDFEFRIKAFFAMWKHVTTSILYVLFHIATNIWTT